MNAMASPPSGTGLAYDARLFEALCVAIERAGLGTFDIDLRSATITLSARAREIFGLSRDGAEEVAQATLQAQLHPDDRQICDAVIDAAAHGAGAEIDAELRVLDPEGNTHRVAPHGRILFETGNGSANPERVVGVVAELGAHGAEHAALALEAGGVGTYEWNPLEDRATWSKIMRRLHGLESPEEPGLARGLACIHPDDVERVKQAMETCLDPAGPGNFHVEYRTHPDGGLRWIESVGRMRFAERGGVRVPLLLIGAAIDITARKQVEAGLLDASRRKDQFLALLGHELRNPLAPLRTACELMRCGQLDARQQQALNEMIARQVTQMASIVDDLLDTARIGLGKISLAMAPVQLEPLLGAVIETCRATCGPRKIALRLDAPPEPLWVEGDAVRLTQVLSNLLNNASKFSNDGSKIEIDLAREGCEAVIRVRDHGKGIPAALLPRLFDLFVQGEATSDREKSGLGLGLPLVRNLVHLHGGRVEAASGGPGTGSEFTVWLPLTRPPVEPPRNHAAETAGTLKRVLIIDDNPDASESLLMLLQVSGQDVRAAPDGEKGLELVERWAPDVMFVDIGLPGIDGYEVARRVRRKPRLDGATLVALTGYGGAEEQQRSREAGFDRHMVKPVVPEAIFEVLRAARAPQVHAEVKSPA